MPKVGQRFSCKVQCKQRKQDQVCMDNMEVKERFFLNYGDFHGIHTKCCSVWNSLSVYQAESILKKEGGGGWCSGNISVETLKSEAYSFKIKSQLP